MKNLDEIKRKLKDLKPILRERFNVTRIDLFGSYTRGEQRRRSDLDMLVEFSEPIGLFQFIALEDFLKEELRVKVDLVMRKNLKNRIRDRIVKEAIPV